MRAKSRLAPRPSSLAPRLGGIDWGLLALGAAASIPGALLGARLTGRLDERLLLKVVGAILLVAGTAAIVQGLV